MEKRRASVAAPERGGRKRRRGEEVRDAEAFALLDSFVTLRMLLEQQHRRCRDTPPIILRNQLYKFLPERSQVDAEMGTLEKHNFVKQLFLPTDGPETLGVMLFGDYERLSLASLADDDDEKEEDRDVLERFFRRVLQDFSPSSLPKNRLSAFLEELLREEKAGDAADDEESEDSTEEDVEVEIAVRRVEEIVAKFSRRQVLLPRADNPSHQVLYFSLPCVRAFCDQLEKGQKSVLRLLRLRRFKEMSVKEVAAQALQRCALPPRVVVDRLEERGLVLKLDTAAGEMIRLKRSEKPKDRRRR